MKKQRGITFLAFAFAFMFAFAAASLGFSQTSGTTSTASSTNTVSATIITGGDGRQLIEAMPGSGTTIIPGVTSGNSPWRPYWPVLNRCIPMTELMAAPDGHSKIRVYTEASPVVRNKPIDQVCLVNWQPNDIAHADDKEIGEATGTGKDGYPDNSAFIPTLKRLVMKTNTRRVAVDRRYLGQFHTKTLSGGFGAAGSATADNNVGGSGAGGFSFGSSKTKNEDPVEFDLIALNDGPVDPPVVQKSPDAPAGTGTSTALPPSQPESKAPSTPTLKVEVDLAAFTSMLQQLLPLKAAATPAAPTSTSNAATTASDCDSLPQKVLYFGFNNSDVVPKKPVPHTEDNLNSILAIERWMEDHPSCNVSVEGYASVEGPVSSNNNLAEQRAENARRILSQDAKIVNQLPRFLSGGKNFVKHLVAYSEYNWEDREVVFSIRNVTSGR